MKVLASIFAILTLASCESPREVLMTYRNYSLQANRLISLQYCDDKKSIRIWISRSTSLDRVITISEGLDSIYSSELTVFGPTSESNQNTKGYFNSKKIAPISGCERFFKQVDSINIKSFRDQKDIEVAYDYPVQIYIIEYLDNGNYSRFRFQPGLINSGYKVLEVLLQKEFPILSKSE